MLLYFRYYLVLRINLVEVDANIVVYFETILCAY